ncbi:MAG: hypothetical protein ACON5F_14370 [Jejuia sp.]
MKKLNILFTLAILITIFACGNDSDEMNPPSANGERSMSFDGAPLIDIDTVQGQFVKAYNVSPTIEAHIIAINYSTGDGLNIRLIDEDENSFPFTNNGVFPINDNPIRATVRYVNSKEEKTIQATDGSVTVTKYERIPGNNYDSIKISGTLSISDTSQNLEATFNNLLLICLECE